MPALRIQRMELSFPARSQWATPENMRIGPYLFENSLALAPMAGVTDRPFRQLCRSLGAGLAASEMISADSRLWRSAKTRRRLDHRGEPEPRIVQIAGGDPDQIAEAARLSQAHGAHIIDINMGCPAKKVCNKAAGSALLKDETLVARIIEAAVAAVSIPVTVKIRTGWSRDSRNGVQVARIAEDAGVAAIAVHGRTRQCRYDRAAEYDTIRAIKECVSVPVLANGDIDSPHKAHQVLAATGADGIMIGRGAQGRPWLFREIAHFLRTGEELEPVPPAGVRDIMLGHLENLYRFYGDDVGVRVARKHIGWYCQGRRNADAYRHRAVRAETPGEQTHLTYEYFRCLAEGEPLAA